MIEPVGSLTDGCTVGSGAFVLVTHAVRNAAQRYRCLHLRQQLGLYGIRSAGQELCELVRARNGDYGVVVLHRTPLDRCLERFVYRVRDAGGLVLFDTDDLVFDSTRIGWVRSLEREGRVKAALYSKETEGLCRTLERADAALVSTGHLADEVSVLGKLCAVHRNGFSLEMLTLSDEAHSRCSRDGRDVVIGYASGTPTHDHDFQVVKSVLEQILARYPGTALWLVGPVDAGRDWGTLSDRVRRIPLVPWQHLPEILAHFDVNIAPLEIGNPVCLAKSEVKYIEAALVRVPTIASRTRAFEHAIRAGENGFLAATTQDWSDSLERLIEDPSLRREMGRRAYADVLARYHPLVRGREVIAALEDLSQRLKGRPLWPDISISEGAPGSGGRPIVPTQAIQEMRRPPLLRRAAYALRCRGAHISAMQAWVYLQQRLAQLLEPVTQDGRS